MMIQRIKFLAVAAIAALLVACGGGGDDATPQYAGSYQANLTMSANTCNSSGLPNTASVTQQVTQSDRNITVYSGTATLTGTIDGDNGGFSVSDKPVINGIEVTRTITFRSNGSTSQYTENMSTSAGPCLITYTGTVTKI